MIKVLKTDLEMQQMAKSHFTLLESEFAISANAYKIATDPLLSSIERNLFRILKKNLKKLVVSPPEEPSFLQQIFVSWFPMLLLIGVWVFFMRQMQGGGKGGAFSFGKSKARMLDETNNTVTFADVAGCDEAKEDLLQE